MYRGIQRPNSPSPSSPSPSSPSPSSPSPSGYCCDGGSGYANCQKDTRGLTVREKECKNLKGKCVWQKNECGTAPHKNDPKGIPTSVKIALYLGLVSLLVVIAAALLA